MIDPRDETHWDDLADEAHEKEMRLREEGKLPVPVVICPIHNTQMELCIDAANITTLPMLFKCSEGCGFATNSNPYRVELTNLYNKKAQNEPIQRAQAD